MIKVSIGRMHQQQQLYRLFLILLLVFQLLSLVMVLYHLDAGSASEMNQLSREGILH